MSGAAPGCGLWDLPSGSLVLASASPRRRLLLRQQGLRFQVVTPRVEETFRRESAVQAARRLARAKAANVALRRPSSWILAADTVVTIDGRLLGKPETVRQAETMLGRLSGRRHTVVTGLALIGPGYQRVGHRSTGVWIRALTPAERWAYAATREPYDKAGGYALQGLGALLVERIAGDWSNVVGLPLALARELLAGAARRQREGLSRSPHP